MKIDLYTYRKGIFFIVTTDNGQRGIGEISPLSSRSLETFDEALIFAKKAKTDLLQKGALSGFFPPSVIFGVESALDQIAHPLTTDLSFALTHLFETPENSQHIPQKEVKLKLGHLPLKEAISIAEQFLNGGARVRLDLHSSFTLEKAISFCSHFKPTDFVYIEDPINRFTQLEPFYDATGFSYAADEFLLFHPLERILPLRGLSHLIIKPTLFGGFDRCKEIKERANIPLVLSSSYESEIGLMQIIRLANRLSISEPLGIDTPPKYPLLHSPLDLKSEKLSQKLFHAPPLNFSLLKAV